MAETDRTDARMEESARMRSGGVVEGYSLSDEREREGERKNRKKQSS
jgi:hypothetical protein